jgi:hypothetical protein
MECADYTIVHSDELAEFILGLSMAQSAQKRTGKSEKSVDNLCSNFKGTKEIPHAIPPSAVQPVMPLLVSFNFFRN